MEWDLHTKRQEIKIIKQKLQIRPISLKLLPPLLDLMLTSSQGVCSCPGLSYPYLWE